MGSDEVVPPVHSSVKIEIGGRGSMIEVKNDGRESKCRALGSERPGQVQYS